MLTDLMLISGYCTYSLLATLAFLIQLFCDITFCFWAKEKGDENKKNHYLIYKLKWVFGLVTVRSVCVCALYMSGSDYCFNLSETGGDQVNCDWLRVKAQLTWFAGRVVEGGRAKHARCVVLKRAQLHVVLHDRLQIPCSLLITDHTGQRSTRQSDTHTNNNYYSASLC